MKNPRQHADRVNDLPIDWRMNVQEKVDAAVSFTTTLTYREEGHRLFYQTPEGGRITMHSRKGARPESTCPLRRGDR